MTHTHGIASPGNPGLSGKEGEGRPRQRSWLLPPSSFALQLTVHAKIPEADLFLVPKLDHLIKSLDLFFFLEAVPDLPGASLPASPLFYLFRLILDKFMGVICSSRLKKE